MQARAMALTHARSRMAVGVALVLAPGLAGSRWIGDDASRPAVKVFARALGVRDFALGLGIAVALDRGAPARGWLEASALSDAVDLVATVLAGDSLPVGARRAAMLVAGGSMLGCAALSRVVDEPPLSDVNAPEAGLTGHH